MEEMLWTEKYRPEKIDDCILPESIKDSFKKYVASGSLPNLLLTGGPGVGKTTVALAAVRELGADVMVINASLNGNIDTLRNEITQFASSVSFSGGRKYVILDEADYLNPNSTQPSLRNFIESFSKNCGFILTCNYPNRIIEPIHSRLITVDFTVSPEERPYMMAAFSKRARQILDAEGVQHDRDVVSLHVARGFPDWRRVINSLQHHAVRGKIGTESLASSKTDFTVLVDAMRAKKFGDVISWVASNSADLDHQGLIREFYDHVSGLVADDSDAATLVVLLSKYQYQASVAADPEINTTAMLVEIAAECNFK